MTQDPARRSSGPNHEFRSAVNPRNWPRFWRDEPLWMTVSFLGVPLIMGATSLLPHKFAVEALIGFGLLILGCLAVAFARNMRRRRHSIRNG
jgi:hypothetical protein